MAEGQGGTGCKRVPHIYPHTAVFKEVEGGNWPELLRDSYPLSGPLSQSSPGRVMGAPYLGKEKVRDGLEQLSRCYPLHCKMNGLGQAGHHPYLPIHKSCRSIMT